MLALHTLGGRSLPTLLTKASISLLLMLTGPSLLSDICWLKPQVLPRLELNALIRDSFLHIPPPPISPPLLLMPMTRGWDPNCSSMATNGEGSVIPGI